MTRMTISLMPAAASAVVLAPFVHGQAPPGRGGAGLKGSADAATWFVGADCRLCSEPVWTVEKKGMR